MPAIERQGWPDSADIPTGERAVRRELLHLYRGGGYGEASAKALPDAIQVADRWHLMENASAAFLDAVRKSMRAIRSAIGSTTITPELLTSAEKLRYESYLRREDTNTAIVALARDGVSIKQIVRRLGHSRNLVRQTLRGGRGTRPGHHHEAPGDLGKDHDPSDGITALRFSDEGSRIQYRAGNHVPAALAPSPQPRPVPTGRALPLCWKWS